MLFPLSPNVFRKRLSDSMGSKLQAAPVSPQMKVLWMATGVPAGTIDTSTPKSLDPFYIVS